MKNITRILLLISIIVIYVLWRNWDMIRGNLLLFMTVKRGIIAPSCPWWRISHFSDIGTGVKLYNEIRANDKRKMIPLNVMGQTNYVVVDKDFIKQLLDKSPNPFGVGAFKNQFFKSFMKLNVGVSEGNCSSCPWKRRRRLNELVLDSDKPHHLEKLFGKNIVDILNEIEPRDFNSFINAGKRVAMKIVFGEDKVYQPIFEMIKSANSMSSIIRGEVSIDPELEEKYYKYLEKSIDSPNDGSLIKLTVGQKLINKEEMVHQIPHWIFPTVGLFGVHGPRLLTILSNNPDVVKKIMDSNYDRIYLRKCILELFRLNNAVNSTFRTLLTDYNFSDKYKFKKGDKFLILNSPVLRDSGTFKNPNRYNPDRWNEELEKSYHAIMFNQGPQRCPGKEIAIFILSIFVTYFLQKSNGKIKSNVKLNMKNIPEAINPCSIKITI